MIMSLPHRIEMTANVRKDVHEHRAPTDESVRLLKEFEEKMFDRLIATLVIKASGFESKVIVYTDPLNSPFSYLARIKFSLGEVHYDFTIEVPHAACRSRDEMIRAIHRAISDKIGEKLLAQILSGENRFHLFPSK